MAYLNYKILENSNPRYGNLEETMIDIDVFFPHLNETVRYTCSKEDPGWEHSEEIYQRAKNEEFGPIAPFIPPSYPIEIDYFSFWDALISSNFYASIRQQSFTSLQMNTLLTEFIALIGDAKSGRPNQTAIQSSINIILQTGTFTEKDLLEFKRVLKLANLQNIIKLNNKERSVESETEWA
jgi:hypothetical protein